jgi:hypothetical protein
MLLIAILKTTGSLALFGVALIKLIEAERGRQFEIIRMIGTLECEIENRRLIGQDYTMLRERHNHLTRLLTERGDMMKNPFRPDEVSPYDNPEKLLNDMIELDQLQSGKEIEQLHPKMNTQQLATRAKDLAHLGKMLLNNEL